MYGTNFFIELTLNQVESQLIALDQCPIDPNLRIGRFI